MNKSHPSSINIKRINEISGIAYKRDVSDYLIIFPVLFYLILAIYKIYQPGIQYDEINFGFAARGMIDIHTERYLFIWLKIRNFPLLIMPYYGALKSYLYYPIFKIFGVSPYTIRLPMIFISALSIFSLYKAISLYFNKDIAILLSTLLAVDPSFLSFTRYDVGPTVIEFCLKIICIYLFILFLFYGRNKYLFFIFMSLAAGLFNKLNFIWFINSFFLAAAVVYWHDWRLFFSVKKPKDKYVFLSIVSISYFLLFGYFILIFCIYGFVFDKDFISFPARISNVYQNLKGVTNGQHFYNYVFGYLSLKIADYFWILVAIIIVVGFVVIIINGFFRNNSLEKSYLFFASIFVLEICQIILTKQAKYGWHVFSTYPLILILLSYSIYYFGKMIPLSIIRRLAWIGIITLIFSYNLFIDTKYMEAYSHTPWNPHWTPAIYDLIKYTSNSKHKFVAVDWGINNQLRIFDGEPDKYVDLAFWLNYKHNDQEENWLNETFLNPDNNYFFITYPPDVFINKTILFNSRKNLFAAAMKYNIKFHLVKKINDSRGQVIYEIYNTEGK